MGNHRQLGNKGEMIAREYLIRHGHRILAANYTFGKAEIDLISEHRKKLIFTEVKTRTYTEFGYPESFVSERQKTMIRRAAEQFIFKRKELPSIRFDIIAVLYEPLRYSLYHFEDAF